MYQEFKIYITFFLCVDMHICTCVYGGTQRHSVQWLSEDNLSSQVSLATVWVLGINLQLPGLEVCMASSTRPPHQPHRKHFKLSLERILQTFQVFLDKNSKTYTKLRV